MRGIEWVVLGLALISAGCSAYFYDEATLRGGATPQREPANLMLPEIDATNAAARGDWRFVRTGAMPVLPGLTSSEALLVEKVKILETNTPGFVDENARGDYAKRYNIKLMALHHEHTTLPQSVAGGAER